MQFTVRARQDGSIGIPVNYRHRLGIQPGTTVMITTDRQGRIWMKPVPATCSCCGQAVSVISTVDGLCAPCERLVEFYIQDGMSLHKAIQRVRKEGRTTEG